MKRGVLARAHTMPEMQALTNLSALGFQKAYQKCPFIAKPAPVDSLDSSVEEPGEAQCVTGASLLDPMHVLQQLWRK